MAYHLEQTLSCSVKWFDAVETYFAKVMQESVSGQKPIIKIVHFETNFIGWSSCLNHKLLLEAIWTYCLSSPGAMCSTSLQGYWFEFTDYGSTIIEWVIMACLLFEEAQFLTGSKPSSHWSGDIDR